MQLLKLKWYRKPVVLLQNCNRITDLILISIFKCSEKGDFVFCQKEEKKNVSV